MMAIALKQSTASQEIPLGPFVDSTDGDTAETALTIANTDIQIWKAGAITLANKTLGGATHISGGIYYTVLDATDTDTLGPLVVFVHVAGALAVRVECVVLAANIYDSGVAGSDKLEVDVVQFGGTNLTASAGRPEVNASHISGDATAADNLEAALDGTGGVTITAALTGNVTGNLSGSVGSVTTVSDKTGYSLSAAGIQAIWDALTSALVTVGSIGKLLVDNIDAAISSRLATSGYTTPPTVGAIADQVWDEALVGHAVAGSAGEALSAAGTAGDPWVTALPGAYGAGTAGNILGNRLVGTIATGTHNPQSGDAFARLGAPAGASVSADVAAVKVDTAATLADTGTDGVVVAAASKSGYALSAAGVQAIWDALTSALTTVSTIGKLLVDNINATISSRASQTSVDTVDANVDAILIDTAEIGTAGAGLTNINLPDQTMNITGNITGNLSGTVGSLAAQAKADVNAEVLDVLNVDTFAEPGQEAPAATNTLVKKIGYLFKFARNKVTQTSTTLSVYDDVGTTVDQKATVSDDATTYTRGEIGTGP